MTDAGLVPSPTVISRPEDRVRPNSGSGSGPSWIVTGEKALAGWSQIGSVGPATTVGKVHHGEQRGGCRG